MYAHIDAIRAKVHAAEDRGAEALAKARDNADQEEERTASIEFSLAKAAQGVAGLLGKVTYAQANPFVAMGTKQFAARILSKQAREFRRQVDELVENEPVEIALPQTIIEPIPSIGIDDDRNLTLAKSFGMKCRGIFLPQYVSDEPDDAYVHGQTIWATTFPDPDDRSKINLNGLLDIDIYDETRAMGSGHNERDLIVHLRTNGRKDVLQTFWTFEGGEMVNPLIGRTDEKMLAVIGTLATGKQYLTDLLPKKLQ